jgi:hypothetical protein
VLAQLPFTAEQFFHVFARYNLAVWPAQWLLTGLALTAVGLVILRPRASSRWVSGVLAALWLWMGMVYHFAFFASINPAARVFGAAFVAQSVLFLWMGARKERWSFRATLDLDAIVGGALVLYALAVYPLIGYLSGHRYPAVPTFGAPCPTTIFTFGVLLWVGERVPWRVVIIPAAWAVLGVFAAIRLSVPQDYGLLIAAVVTVALLARRSASRRSPGSSSQRIRTMPTRWYQRGFRRLSSTLETKARSP